MKKYLLRVAALVSFCPVVIIPYMVNAVDFGCQGGTCTNSWRGWTYVSGHAGYSAPTAPDWIKCYTSGPSSGGSGGTCYAIYEVEPNNSVYARSGRLSYTMYQSVGTYCSHPTVYVHQDGCPSNVITAQDNFESGGGIGQFHVIVDENVSWSAYVQEWCDGDYGAVDWIELEKTNGVSECSFYFTVKPNILCRERSAVVHVADKLFTIRQRGFWEYTGKTGIISGAVMINISPVANHMSELFVNEHLLCSATTACSYLWQPQNLGTMILRCVSGTNKWDRSIRVENFASSA